MEKRPPQDTKRAYVSPKLAEYGPLRPLTQTSAAGMRSDATRGDIAKTA